MGSTLLDNSCHASWHAVWLDSTAMTQDDLVEAWAELHRSNEALCWCIGPTTFEPRLGVPWSLEN